MSIGFSITFGLERRLIAATLRCFDKNPKLNESMLMGQIGVGSTKAKAFILWLGMLGFRDNKKRELTPLGKLVAHCDSYLDDTVSQWLLHYQLAQNQKAEVWFHLTNKFLPSSSIFTFEDALESLKAAGIGEHSPKHLVSDTKIYLRALTTDEGLGQIHFIEPIENSVFKKGIPQSIHPLLVAYVIYDQREKRYPSASTIRITNLLTDDGNVGKVFSLTKDKLEEILEKLRFERLLDVSYTAGLDQVGFTYKGSAFEILERYYKSEGNARSNESS